jgi:predicted transposase/invertase (TIGR01784 family)
MADKMRVTSLTSGTGIVDGLEPGRSITDRAVVRHYRSRNFACGFLLSEEVGVKTIQLVEEFLVRRFAELSREEIRVMFQLEDLRKTRVWREAHEEGRLEGRKKGREEMSEELVHKWLAKGMAVKDIAALLDISIQEVRRLRKNGRR